MQKFICPALGGVSDTDPTDLCPPKHDPENLCCFSCSLATPNRPEGSKPCPDECMQIKNGQQSCGSSIVEA